VLQGTLTVGSLLVVIAYLAAVYTPLSSIAHTTGSLQQAVVSARRVRETLALTPEPFDVAGARDAAAITGDIRFEQVGFAYDERTILQDVSFGAPGGAGCARRPDRRRQDDSRQPAAPLLRAHRWPHHHRRRGCVRLRPAVAA
jgi:ATP-binding cassette subfamily B protein